MFRKKEINDEQTLDLSRIPNHVAIIMDGNGRWAQKRHLPRIAGHKRGMETVKTITKAASQLGVKVLTLYAFSTENWKRPEQEVNYLMSLPGKFFSNFVPELVANNVSVNVMGELDQLPEETQKVVLKAIDDTADCDGMILNFALNYGSRREIILATKQIANEVQSGNLATDDIDSAVFSNALMTSSLGEDADPDLLIRTSGEQRISNFLLWQIAYSELYFTDELWPDFKASSLKRAILTFQHRDRRFGGIKQNK
ncbi:isoprenyl transferase [Nicoliella spurrieriana]|uniref:Isoprenyl transferase n=1 Tax=Nicoliella spurrieriana TaxID=2925830 RepID=A0A976RRL1_9LACO|nr:isoprenyl transferase [Nicoliella spurrieriana]UQS86499.1 isoprenyl transferase [Nicoliella spurrieriana]